MTVDTAKQIVTDERPQQRLPVLHDLMGGVLGYLGRFWIRHSAVLGSLMICGFMAVVMAIAWLRPIHSWDMIAYLASSLNGSFESAAALHSHVWEIIRNGVPAEKFTALSEGDGYRVRQFTDPDAFQSMLPLYEVKLLYIKAIGLFAPVVGPINAGFAINVAAVSVFTATMCWWLLRTRLMHLAPIVVGILMIAGFPDTAMGETPDMLCAAFAMSGVMLLDRGRLLFGSIATVFAVAVRPDMAAFVGVLLAAMWFWNDKRLFAVIGAFAVSLLIYIAASKLAAHPGWWPHVYFSTYHIQDTLVGFDPDFSIQVYATGFAWNLIRSAFENSWLGIYVALLGGWALVHAGGLKMAKGRHVLITALLAAIAAKYLVFPLHDSRVYLPLLLPAALLLMGGIRDAASSRSV